MTRNELHAEIADAIEAAFDGTKRDGTGRVRPFLSRPDCEFVADTVFSAIARARPQLTLYELDDGER